MFLLIRKSHGVVIPVGLKTCDAIHRGGHHCPSWEGYHLMVSIKLLKHILIFVDYIYIYAPYITL